MNRAAEPEFTVNDLRQAFNAGARSAMDGRISTEELRSDYLDTLKLLREQANRRRVMRNKMKEVSDE